MDIAGILQPSAQRFILTNEGKDPSKLMLAGKGVPGVPLVDLICQIKARAIISAKVPGWYQNPHVIYPDSLPLQQCSSELTGTHKSRSYSGSHLVDLTGGLGVDAYFFSKHFDRVTYIERSRELCTLARHNFKALRAKNIVVVHGSAEDEIRSIKGPVDMIYVDPARRLGHRKVFKLDQCDPPILDLVESIWQKTSRVLLKLSPLMDIKEALAQLTWVKSVEVVSLKNECKELLLELEKEFTGPPRMRATNITSHGNLQCMDLYLKEEAEASCTFEDPRQYIYEPNCSILKLGAFKTVSTRLAVSKLHPNSHLYTSNRLINDFPGRTFKIQWVIDYNKKKLGACLPEGKANITVRNFPYSVAAIRKSTGIKEGGSSFLFATTLKDGKLAIICGEKL